MALTRKAALITAAVAGVTVAATAGVALAGGAFAHGSAPLVAASAVPPTTSAASSGMPAIWSQTEEYAREFVCTTFLANPAGTWQAIAPALTPEGVTRAEAFAFLTGQCSPEASISALRG